MKISIERTGKATVANLNLDYTLFTLKPHNMQQRPRLCEKGLLLFHIAITRDRLRGIKMGKVRLTSLKAEK